VILVIDNYDSFVHNLARYLREMGCAVEIARNDQITVSEVQRRKPSAIVISPGPCTPREAGESVALIRELAPSVPILGVCLGHQAIAAACGGRVVRAAEPMHGKTSLIHHSKTPLFAGLENPFRATRYHSLIVDEGTLPPELRVTARTADGVPMAIEHSEYRTFGVQFHPESVLTDSGHRLLANFLSLAGAPVDSRPAGDHVAAPSADGWEGIEPTAAGPLHW
jgi:anthranilate synthase/aminodeoxychorismate synthase-like glutamine amidotransferase